MGLHVKKTISWTIISAIITFVVVFAFTGSWEYGLGVSLVGRVIKVVAYYRHEGWWEKHEQNENN
jgi:uncharacterized membrane protein